MYEARVQYALDNFILDDFFINMSTSYDLMETSKGGESCLHVTVNDTNLCLAYFDNKPKCAFLRDDPSYGMKKSSDHLIFYKSNHEWKLCIIEMKTSVGQRTWDDIKKKTRTSYLTAQAIAVFLGITITEHSTQVYTTYENEKFYSAKGTTTPALYKALLGKKVSDYKKEEWDKDIIKINISNIISLPHKAIKMTRNTSTNILEGTLIIS
jgi:hypothetical protein